MFGRKHKRDEDNLGLSAPMVPTTVSVTASSSPVTAIPAPTPTPTTNQSPTTIPTAAIGAGAVPADVSATLNQILGGHGPVGALIAAIKADPQGFRERIMQQAQAAGVSSYIVTNQGMTGVGGAGVVPGRQVDVVEELTKAAALHDQGALTDAEFETLKKKLISQ